MLSYDEIAYPELKQAVRLLNETGFVKPVLKLISIEGSQLYSDFINSVEKLTEEQKQKLDEPIIDFFNFAVQESKFEDESEPEIVEPKIVEPASTSTQEIPIKPKESITKRTKLSKVVMSPKVSNGKLTIAFKELNISQTFILPSIDDKAALKPIRKEAMDFATANGATKGQLCNISKTLNLAGYYAR